MKVGLISDTHLPALGVAPPPEVARAFEDVDLILHAGDIYNSACLDWLEQFAPVIAVEVPPAPVIGDPRVEERRVLTLDGYSVGLVHDLALPRVDEVIPGALERSFPADRSIRDDLAHFFGTPVDIAVFGHSHIAVIETFQGVLFVNPGSPTLPRQVRRLGSVAILDLAPQGPHAELIELTTLRD